MSRPLITERHIREALAQGVNALTIPQNAIVTALAHDSAREKGLTLTHGESGNAPSSSSEQPKAPPKSLAVGCDHAGFSIKKDLAAHAESEGFKGIDLGTTSPQPVDYPEIAYAVARAVALGQARFGLIIDGVGVGSAIVANKVPGIRAVLCPDVFSAFNARAHNDANILTLGSRTIGIESSKRILSEFLKTPFEGGRHARRVGKIEDVERRFPANMGGIEDSSGHVS